MNKNEYFYKIFENARNSVINELFTFVNKQKDKTVILNERDRAYSYIIDRHLINQKYNKLYIKDNILYIELQESDGIEPNGYDTYSEDINVLSMNEVYDIINHIK